MKCTECQNEIPKGSVFCPVCGSAQFEEPVEEILQPVAEVCEAQPPEIEDKPPVKSKKKWWILAACLALAAVAVALVSIHKRPAGYGAYMAGGSVYLTDLTDGEPIMLMEYGSCWDLVMTEDQNQLFYIGKKSASQTRELYHLDLGASSREPEVLAKNVGLFYANTKGTRVAYLRDGKLYLHDLKSEKQIAENVTQFSCDENFDTFVYCQTTMILENTATTTEQAWYIKEGDSQPRIVGDGRKGVSVMHFSADGKTLVFTVSGKLYVRKNGVETLIAENASPQGVYDDGSFYYRTGNIEAPREWCYYDGEKSIDITADQGVRVSLSTLPVLCWQEGIDIKCYLSIRDRVLEVPLKQVDNVILSEDETRICLSAWDEDSKNLYVASVTPEGLGPLWLLAEDERSAEGWFVGEKLYYWVGDILGTGTLFCDGEVVLQDVKEYVTIHRETGALLVQGEKNDKYEAAVYLVQDGKSTKLTEKGKEQRFTSNGDALVIVTTTDGASELWHFDGNGKGTRIAENASDVLALTRPTLPGRVICYDFL